MSLSSVSSSHRFSNHLNTSQPPQTVPPITPPAGDTGETGERRLLALYTRAIRQATQTDTGAEKIDGIARDSKFGAWWQQLFDATHSPIFLEWAKSKNIDTSQPINIDAFNDTLTVTINGKRTELNSDGQEPGWRELTAPIMAAAKAMGQASIDAPTRPDSAPLIQVARFYGEVLLPYRKEETLARATQLDHNQAFDVLGPDTYVDGEAQSSEALEQQKGQLGDSINQFKLLQKLREISEAQYVDVAGVLASKKVAVHPDSSYRQDTERAETSVTDWLAANGLHVPQNQEELDNLIRALAAPGLTAPDDGNLGGALAWPEPMSTEDQAELFRIIADNQPPLPGLNSDARLGSADVLGALVKNVPRTLLNQGDPRAVVQWILTSKQGQQLGAELKKRLGEIADQSTSREVLLTALAVTLDTQSLDEPKENHVSGFNLAAPQFHGQPLSVIKKALIDHLVETNQTTPEAAPVAAMLMLSRAAPELLVKDVPDSATYGSFSWLALKSAVARIEATTPGASAHMTFAEIVAFDTVDPVSEQEEQIQQQTRQPAIIEWGKLHGTLPMTGPYSSKQVEDTQLAISTQQQSMLSAINAFIAPVPTQRSVALAELKARFGEGIPFEEKSIRSHRTTTDSHKLTPSISTDPLGSYSLLDLYLAKKAGLDVGWHSSNSRITQAMIKAVAKLPDPIEKHKTAFDDYQDNLEQGWNSVTRNLISTLPLEDRKNIETGQLTVYRRGTSEYEHINLPGVNHTSKKHFRAPERDGALIIKTERNGVTDYYEIDPQRNVLRRRDDWRDTFREGLQGSWSMTTPSIGRNVYTAPTIERISPEVDDESKEQAGVDHGDFPRSFSSPRSQYLGRKLSESILARYKMGEVEASTVETTTFDDEERQKAFMRNLILGFVPGASAVWNLANGNYLDAAGDAIFDVVMYATTAGLGKAGTGVAKGTRSSKAGVPKPFGRSFLKGIGQGARPGTQAGSSFLENLSGGIRSRVIGRVKQSGVQLNRQQARLVAERTDLFEGTAKASGSNTYYQTIARYNPGNRKWYAYNPATNKPYGKPLVDFKPSSSTHLETKWQNLTRNVENGPQGAAFRDGYLNGDPKTVPGYFSGMTSAQVKKLTVTNKTLSPKQIGILVRQQERLAVQHGLGGVNTFNDLVRAAGGRVTPMPQIFYLSQTQPLSKGQCAALSHLMAEAASKGKAQTLIDNFYKAAANPTAKSSKTFIQTLSELQKRVETPTGFHGIGSDKVPSRPYTAIADELVKSPGSKTLMLGDEGHAMNAGVIVDGNTRTYFFFDPNYGIATFPSVESMREGLKRVFNNKNFARPYKSTGPANQELQIKVSEYDGFTLEKVGADQHAVANTYMAPLE
ncbi:YopT-type cysteine protease domain-containing protein [Pseudomonas sp. S1_E04]